jgi:hypothetical protein
MSWISFSAAFFAASPIRRIEQIGQGRRWTRPLRRSQRKAAGLARSLVGGLLRFPAGRPIQPPRRPCAAVPESSSGDVEGIVMGPRMFAAKIRWVSYVTASPSFPPVPYRAT